MFRLLFLLLLVVPLCTRGQLTYPLLRVAFDSAITYKHLRIIPVYHREEPRPQAPEISILGLKEALHTGKAKVRERGDHMLFDLKTLVVDNLSDKYLLLLAGEILAGGRQDRVIARDVLVPPKTQKVEIPVFCIEEGRWSDKESKFRYHGSSDNSLRSLMDSTMDQQKIWKFIRRAIRNKQLETETESYLNLLNSKQVSDTLNDYFNYFSSRFRAMDSVYVGIICISGNRVIGSDLFLSSSLFYAQLGFLLQGYITETLLYGGPIIIAAKEINQYADELLTPRTQETFVNKRGKLFKDEKGRVIHINTY